MYVCAICFSVCARMRAGAFGEQQKALDPLELELEVRESHLAWMLEIKFLVF